MNENTKMRNERDQNLDLGGWSGEIEIVREGGQCAEYGQDRDRERSQRVQSVSEGVHFHSLFQSRSLGSAIFLVLRFWALCEVICSTTWGECDVDQSNRRKEH